MLRTSLLGYYLPGQAREPKLRALHVLCVTAMYIQSQGFSSLEMLTVIYCKSNESTPRWTQISTNIMLVITSATVSPLRFFGART